MQEVHGDKDGKPNPERQHCDQQERSSDGEHDREASNYKKRQHRDRHHHNVEKTGSCRSSTKKRGGRTKGHSQRPDKECPASGSPLRMRNHNHAKARKNPHQQARVAGGSGGNGGT